MERWRRYPMRLLAEKVKTRQQFQECYDLGFHLFLYQVPIDDLVRRLRLSENVSTALVGREGPFGGLLRLVEHLEGLEVEMAMNQVQALQMTRQQVLDAQWKAYAWRSRSAVSSWTCPEADVATGGTFDI